MRRCLLPGPYVQTCLRGITETCFRHHANSKVWTWSPGARHLRTSGTSHRVQFSWNLEHQAPLPGCRACSEQTPDPADRRPGTRSPK
jgi:hypothetical protein